MGYTHYWYGKGDISPEAWAKIKADAEALIAAAPIPLLFEYDSNELPKLSDNSIRFNGKHEDGHETFLFERMTEEFTFCKTACKPYDDVVVAVLACAAEHAPDNLTIQSDGDETDWAAALTWAGRVLGRNISYPVKD